MASIRSYQAKALSLSLIDSCSELLASRSAKLEHFVKLDNFELSVKVLYPREKESVNYASSRDLVDRGVL